jgi:uncharacterized membrane protein
MRKLAPPRGLCPEGGYKKTMQMCLFGFFATFLLLAPLASNAQVPEITGTSTENLMGPGVNIDVAPDNLESNNAPSESESATSEPTVINNIVERSRYGSYERAIVKAVDQITSQTETGAELKNNYTIQILTGDFKDKTFSIRGGPSDKLIPETGDLIMVFIQPGGNDRPQIFFETYDRKNIYIFSLIFLTIILLVLFGLRGLLIGLTVCLVLWLGIYTSIPLYLRNWPILLVTSLTTLLLSTISSLLLFGWHKKAITTTIATILATALTTIIAQIITSSMHLTVTFDAIGQAFFKDHPTINPSQLIIIGLILACFAIIQDITSSISCGVAELKKIRPNAKWQELFTSGMNIGRTHAATMILVLVLTWIGSSISIFLYRYQQHTSWLHFLNQDAVSATMLLAIAGTIGILFSVPIAAIISATAWTSIPKPKDPSTPIPSWKEQMHD